MALLEAAGNPSLEHDLNQVLIASERAKHLVQKILAFSRSHPSDSKVMAFPAIIEEVLGLMRPALPSSIRIDRQIARDLPPVLADATQMHQVLVNLCANAGYAMQGRQGRLLVKVDAIILDEAMVRRHSGLQPGKYVRLIVGDSGCGMTEAVRKRLFEPFFTTKPPGEGTGLGLAVVHGIVKEHAGAISVHSEVEQGTEFEILLPASEAQCERESIIQENSKPGKGENIMVVDDELAVGVVTCKILDRLGYRSRSFTDPSQALSVFSGNPVQFDLVITDLTMPGMSGLELGKRLLAIRPSLPIIMSTGYGNAATAEQARLSGISRLIHKPSTPAVLSREVHELLRSKNTGPNLLKGSIFVSDSSGPKE
jgi:CheY-like chemotaxis protein